MIWPDFIVVGAGLGMSCILFDRVLGFVEKSIHLWATQPSSLSDTCSSKMTITDGWGGVIAPAD